MGWVSLKGLSAFGIMIQWKYCVADCCRIFLHRRKNYSPWWSVNVFLFLPVLSTVKTASAHLLSPQNIRRVPCLSMSISVLWLQWASPPSPLPCFSGDSPHPEWDVIATIGLYNIVHKSSLCECTFDKVYLFIFILKIKFFLKISSPIFWWWLWGGGGGRAVDESTHKH